MSLDRRISIVTLGVEDVARSTAFYEKLGWKRSSVSQEAVTDASVENTPKGFSGVTLAHNVASERGVDAVVKFAVSCGALLVKAPEKVFWGGYSGYVADPDGHLWEIAHNPFFTMDEQGHVVLPE